MTRLLLFIILGFAAVPKSSAQELFVYPEAVTLFEKDLKEVGCDLLPAAQGIEMLSPGMVRNSWLTMMLVVKGRPGQQFALHTGQNPEGALELAMYRYFPGLHMPGPLYPPRLERVSPDTEARIPEGQRCAIYFLDVFAPSTATPGRIRLDPSIWTPREDGERFWKKTPLEIRVLDRVIAEPLTQFQQCTLPAQTLLSHLMDGVATRCRPNIGRCEVSPIDSLEGLLTRNLLQDVALLAAENSCTANQPPAVNPARYFEYRRKMASGQ